MKLAKEFGGYLLAVVIVWAIITLCLGAAPDAGSSVVTRGVPTSTGTQGAAVSGIENLP